MLKKLPSLLILQVTITQEHKYESEHSAFSSVSAETDVSYGGLFYSGGASGGFTKKQGNTSLTQKGSNLKITFKIRKVLVQRPWFQPSIMQYPTLGINGVPQNSWSNGELSFKDNRGLFPILPTAFVVAKDVVIHADSFTKTAQTSFESLDTHAGFKVSKRQTSCLS